MLLTCGKLWGTFAAGTVPVYYGAPNVESHVPPNSIINANKFNTTEDLAKYLVKVANNKTLYESYHSWRYKPLPESFIRRYNMTRTHSTCRTCRWAAAKKYGLGWNHQRQEIGDLRIPRKVCHDSKGILTHPFHETWISGNGQRSVLVEPERESPYHCETKQTTLATSLRFGNHVLNRTVRSQDGVIDIHLEDSRESQSTSASLILRMATQIDGQMSTSSFKSLSLRHYRLQDEEKRMTILTSRNAILNVTEESDLELHISRVHQAMKVRIIVEDIESYPDSRNRTFFFGQMLTEDFLNPLEKFVVWGKPKNETDWVGREMATIGLISAMQDDDTVGYDDALREGREHEQRIREEAEAVRLSLIKVKDEAQTAAEKQALDGIKKLIADGVIKVKTDQEAS